jgi:hypothetical protein
MAKTFARVVFFGAVFVGLFYGCSDASVRCLGRASSCEGRLASQCIEGCSLKTGCLGDDIVCGEITEGALCDQTPGCERQGSCEGVRQDGETPTCEELAATPCRSTPGCQYVVSCVGPGTPCGELDQDTCELYPECKYQSQCSGSADSCGDVGTVEQCRQVPGCYPADTDPSIIPE